MPMNIDVGDTVRLKDSPYEGKVISCGNGDTAFRDKATGAQITVRSWPNGLLQTVLEPPQVGDIYEDKNGNEWVIRDAGSYRRPSPSPFLVAHLLTRPENGYAYGVLALAKAKNLQDWADNYRPKLVRRRGR